MNPRRSMRRIGRRSTTTASSFEMTERLRIFATLLSQRAPGRLLDLACGHGTFSLVAQRLGWTVTAVDVRTGRMPKTEGIDWVEADVREFPIAPAAYDFIAVLGLLYHLELKDQLDLLRRCSTAPTLVDTHVAAEETVEEAGYSGTLFDEYAGRSAKDHAASPRASWKNRYSFWATEESLIRMFYDCGFARVMALVPRYLDDRTFYLCLPDDARIATLGDENAAGGDQ